MTTGAGEISPAFATESSYPPSRGKGSWRHAVPRPRKWRHGRRNIRRPQKATTPCHAMPDGHEPARSHAGWLAPGARARACARLGSPAPPPAAHRRSSSVERWCPARPPTTAPPQPRGEPDPSTSQPRSIAPHHGGQPADRRRAARRGGSHGHAARARTYVRGRGARRL
ncbi:hypothetical protein PVAP13_2KG347909 [Panicum virgatum]|uniref:Uncharacterized protein n=1 Tax=Panicum virgatum TaxID=38727 RepID=A0A8T0WKL4_PANVG|nr:hypothetical protein PVAP13_2KG347909 [Panicum virgatum]